MNREILFRGKRLEVGQFATEKACEWVYGGYAKDCSGAVHIYDTTRASRMVRVDPNTVGQYTGLTDKNGVKIFEGDILGSHYDDGCPEDVTIEIIVWSENGWGLEIPGGDVAPVLDDGGFPHSEVIGNIHDNPELLEVSNETD